MKNNHITKEYLKEQYYKRNQVLGISREKQASLVLGIVVLAFIIGKLSGI